MEIKQIDEKSLRKLVENIENGKTRLVLVENGKKEVFITEEEKRSKMEDAVKLYDRVIPILIHTIIGDIAVKANKKEKNIIINEELKEIKKQKSIMFNSDYELDDIETIKSDFCDVINSITNHENDYEGNLFDEEIDEFEEEVKKCKVKK